jgi:hypothetical protein
VIVVYEEENLLLHGVRDITTLQELEPVGFAEKYQWKVVQTFGTVHWLLGHSF